MSKKKPESNSTTLSKKVKNPAAKGKQFEREVANALGHIFPEAERNLEYQSSKCVGVDLAGTEPFLIQCKNHQNYKSVGTIKEIIIQKDTDIPVLITKGVRQKAMAVLPFEKLVTLLEVVYGLVPHWGEHKEIVNVTNEITNDVDAECIEYTPQLSSFI